MKAFMKKHSKQIKRTLLILLGLWLGSLGVHIYVADYSVTNPIEPEYTRNQIYDGQAPYHVLVRMENTDSFLGIPLVFTVTGASGIPYPTEFVIMVDESKYDLKSFVLDSLICRFPNGKEQVIVDTPQTGTFSELTLYKSDIKEGLSLKETRILLTGKIKKRGSYDIKYRGHFTESEKIIEGTLRMDYIKAPSVCIGWFIVMIMFSGV